MDAVGVVGTGAMGSRLARRLIQTGHEVIVWNRSPEKTSPLVDLGASVCATPADVARRADYVITMVADPPALRSVTESEEGIAAGAGSGLTVIDMSTVGPGAIERLASALPLGTGLLDAPVLGSLAEAEAGSLNIFVGGPAGLVGRATPLLMTLGTVLPVGPLGAGAAAKLVANAALFGSLVTLGEVITLSRALGLSSDVTARVLASTPLAAQAERRHEAIEPRRYPLRFALSLACKDATLISEVATATGTDLRVASAVEAWLCEAAGGGLGTRDYTAVLETILYQGNAPGREIQRSTMSVPSVASPRPLDFDGLIVDLDGVIWRGEQAIGGAAAAIAAVRARGIRVVFLTNEPRYSRTAFAQRLVAVGIPAAPDDVITSAYATGRALASQDSTVIRRAFVIGPAALRHEVQDAGYRLVSGHEEKRGVGAVVAGAHEGFDYGELRTAANLVRGGARLFAPGSDAVFPTQHGFWPGTGAILAAIETASGVRGIVVGKPEPIMFELAEAALAGCERVAMVGDHLISDIAGAKRAGLQAILVMSGVTNRGEIGRALIPPDLVLESIAELPGVLGLSR
jgi:HAD superfamily hydrolase (TIGR01450 family)